MRWLISCVLHSWFLLLFWFRRGNASSAVIQGDCKWELPLACKQIEPSYQINLHFVEYNGTKFPDHLKEPIRAAADFWSRAIAKRQQPHLNTSSHLFDDVFTRKFCGQNILSDRSTLDVCFRYYSFMGNKKQSIGLASILHRSGAAGKLPELGKVDLNSDKAWSHCAVANVAAHELAHVLGFHKGLPAFGYVAKCGYVIGKNAKREWLESGGHFLPRLNLKEKADHWHPDCFDKELMLPSTGDVLEREPLSTVTLAVFKDIGYDVNFACADGQVPLSATCEENHEESTPDPEFPGESIMQRFVYFAKEQISWFMGLLHEH